VDATAGKKRRKSSSPGGGSKGGVSVGASDLPADAKSAPDPPEVPAAAGSGRVVGGGASALGVAVPTARWGHTLSVLGANDAVLIGGQGACDTRAHHLALRLRHTHSHCSPRHLIVHRNSVGAFQCTCRPQLFALVQCNPHLSFFTREWLQCSRGLSVLQRHCHLFLSHSLLVGIGKGTLSKDALWRLNTAALTWTELASDAAEKATELPTRTGAAPCPALRCVPFCTHVDRHSKPLPTRAGAAHCLCKLRSRTHTYPPPPHTHTHTHTSIITPPSPPPSTTHL
jgi:hypothetical protein